MAYNPYYVPKQYPTYNQGYYSTEKMNNFYQSMPNQNSFSSGGSFQQTEAPQQSIGGDTMNKVGSITQGIGQIAGYTSEVNAKVRAINPNIESQEQYDPNGQPYYNLGSDQQRYVNANTNVAKGLVGKSALAGAQAGMSFGPVGAAIGTFAGAVYGGFTRNIKRQKAKKRKKRLLANLTDAQNRFNEQSINYNQNQLARSSYEDQIRRNNPYGLPSNYY